MRILGIDYGRRRIGLAISDEAQYIARPLDPYHRTHSRKRDLQAIARIAHEQEAGCIVFGLPLNMDGSRGEMVLEVEAFAKDLHPLVDLAIATTDERLTSVEAERVLLQGNVKRKDRKLLRDGLAATLILQGYLDSLSFSEESLDE